MTVFDNRSNGDEELAQSICRGGPSAREAFAELYRRHAQAMLAFLATRVPRSDVEDMHHEIWVRVWERLPKSFTGGSFRGWLFTVARRLVIDASRKRKPNPVENIEQTADANKADHHTPDEQLLEDERREILQRCLEQLDGQSRDLIRGRLAGESYDEVCARIGLAVQRAHRLYFKIKEQLSACVEQRLAS